MAARTPRWTKFVLGEDRIRCSRQLHSLADLPVPPAPVLHPGTGPAERAPATGRPLFPMALILQEVSAEPDTEIPDEVREAYTLYRSSSLLSPPPAAVRLDTPAHIYYKRGGAESGREPTSGTPPSRRPGTTSRKAVTASPPS